MNNYFKSIILQKTSASSLAEKEVIQELWSGYGKVIRIQLKNSTLESVVAKHIQLPKNNNHPRGWNTDIGHQRKLKSYDVEASWYQHYSKHSMARLPKCFAIDKKLNNCNFKTFIHGDAKLANFCFSENGQVAGVDFQYVGGGCGMKDVAYFVGSCLNENDCERLESKLLDTYFTYLHKSLGKKNEALEEEWRSLYRVAWADFHRFLKGWSPRHWKINSYSERITAEVIKNL